MCVESLSATAEALVCPTDRVKLTHVEAMRAMTAWEINVSLQIGIVDGDASGVDLAECQQMKLPDERVQMSSAACS